MEQITPKAAPLRPGKKWFLLPALLFVAAVVGFVLFFVAIISTVNAPRQYIIPGRGVENLITIEKEGTYTLFYEYTYTPRLYDTVSFSFVGTETGGTFTSTPPRGSQTYRINELHGTSVAQVTLPPGEYMASTSYTPYTEDDRVYFTLSGGSLFIGVAGGILSMFAAVFCFIAAFASLVILVIRRSRAKQTAAAPPAPGPGPYPPYSQNGPSGHAPYPPPYGGPWPGQPTTPGGNPYAQNAATPPYGAPQNAAPPPYGGQGQGQPAPPQGNPPAPPPQP